MRHKVSHKYRKDYIPSEPASRGISSKWLQTIRIYLYNQFDTNIRTPRSSMTYKSNS